MTRVKLTDNLGGDLWPILKKHIAKHTDNTDVIYMQLLQARNNAKSNACWIHSEWHVCD
jgi:hypothetical protein